jgi:dodecin
MSVARVTEMKASSTVSFDDALKQGIARATKTLKNVKSAWIENQEVELDEQGGIAEYRVHLRVTFVLED